MAAGADDGDEDNGWPAAEGDDRAADETREPTTAAVMARHRTVEGRVENGERDNEVNTEPLDSRCSAVNRTHAAAAAGRHGRIATSRKGSDTEAEQR